MADFRAIEAASRTLRALLRDRMVEPVSVTLAPPDIEPEDVAEERRVNLYLLEVKEHAQLKNQMPPGDGAPGAYGRPPLSLELIYLLTTHVPSETGPEADLTCQRMLGDSLGALHDHAIVTRSLLAITANDRPLGAPILDPGLLDEHEAIKINLHPTALDDFAKVWTALPAAAFRRAVMLTVSVVQIESIMPSVSPRPVATRRIATALLRRPAIGSVFAAPASPGDPETETRVRLGQEITIRGQNLQGAGTWVRLGGLDPITVTPENGGARLRIVLPDTTYPAAADPPGPRPIPPSARLRAGVLPVQVIVLQAMESVSGGRDDLGTPGALLQKVFSDMGVLQLLPEVTAVNPPSAAATPATTVVVQGRRLFAPGVATTILIGDVAIEAHRLAGAPPPDDRVEIPLASLAAMLPRPPAAGTDYPVRAIVDGAMSAPLAAGFKLLP
ncbi:hypothetical protein AWB71_06087 [Caballeronia peredens]|nr:hypothetical protein AWB71_06087 [Caballeronia peredens]